MNLLIPTAEQLKTAYSRDLAVSFPLSELKPLEAIEYHLGAKRYRPWCLFDEGELIGEAFLWLGNPGWALLDYLCVTPERRNAGLGGVLLKELCEAEVGTVIIAETETPEWAPDGALAARREAFYRRNGARFTPFRACIFGVVYDLIYWADKVIPDEMLMREYDVVYRGSFPAEKYRKYIQIPWTEEGARMPRIPWNEEKEKFTIKSQSPK